MEPTTQPPPHHRPRSKRLPLCWYVVAMLIVAYTFSFIDRQILTLMVGPIRETLKISDTQLSLLHGFAFALFYSVMGIPIGRLVDSRKRTTIISIGVAVWSVMTALCGLAESFIQLFLARIGVGVGEAALSPGAYSMISDYFPPHQRARALSLYISAAYVGGGIATIAGGALIAMMGPVDLPLVGQMEPWQSLFIIVGLPGLLVALWMLTLREPERTDVKAGAQPALRWCSSSGAEQGGVCAADPRLCDERDDVAGAIAWIPTYFIRIFGWTAREVSLPYGLISMVAGMSGIILGGWIATRMRRAGEARCQYPDRADRHCHRHASGDRRLSGRFTANGAWRCSAYSCSAAPCPGGARSRLCRKSPRTRCAARSPRSISSASACSAWAWARRLWRSSPTSSSAMNGAGQVDCTGDCGDGADFSGAAVAGAAALCGGTGAGGFLRAF